MKRRPITLLATVSRAVVAGCLAHLAAHAADVSQFTLLKGQRHTQTSYRGPTPAVAGGHEFAAKVRPTVFANLTAAEISAPSGTATTLVPSAATGEWQLQAAFDSSYALDQNFPNGGYTLATTTANDGAWSAPLALAGDSYPNAPRIANYIAAQMVSTNNAFLMTWDPFVGGTTNDFIYVEVFDLQRNQVKLTSGAWGTTGALNGTATSFTIPARTLQAGRTYPSYVLFVKATRDTTSYPGAVGLLGYYARTEFTIKGVNQNDLVPSTLIDPALLPDGRFQFTVVGMANRTYVLSRTADYLTWTPFLTNTAPGGGVFTVADPVPAGPVPQFYRAQTLR